MAYEQSYEIEQRLQTVLRCVAQGVYSTPQIADELGVSIPTVSRCVQALRGRGHMIRSEKHREGWRYVLESASEAQTPTGRIRKGAHA